MLLSSCMICNSTKSKFIKEQEASGSFLKSNLPFKKCFSIGDYLLKI